MRRDIQQRWELGVCSARIVREVVIHILNRAGFYKAAEVSGKLKH